MPRVRRVEKRTGSDAEAGIVPGVVRLRVVQCADSVGDCSQFVDEDRPSSTDCGRGHCLAEGVDSRLPMAEIPCRENNMYKGQGGSMQVEDQSRGIVGVNGISGTGVSIITGAVLAVQRDGDGTAILDIPGETSSMAVVCQVPVNFVRESNGFSENSSTVTAGRNLLPDGEPCVAIHEAVDGNDLIGVRRCAAHALKHARTGDGPSLFEERIRSRLGHVEAEASILGSG